MNKRKNAVLWIIAALLLAGSTVLGILNPAPSSMTVETPDPRIDALEQEVARIDGDLSQVLLGGVSGAEAFSSDRTGCYREQGGVEWVAGSGCTWTMESGSTLDVQSGTSVTLAGYVTSTIDSLTVGTAIVTSTLAVSGTTDLVGNVSSSTGAVTITDAVNITSTLDVDGTFNADGNTTLGGTLTLESVAFSGPVRFGSASSVVSGTLIAHGLGITPTAVLLTSGSTTVMTVPAYLLATNATSFTVAISDSVTIPTLYWLAGK